MRAVVVVDYGMCNLDSVARALEESGALVSVTGEPDALAKADAIILPGVGAFADGMMHLRERGLDQAILEQVVGEGIPILGVCLGMQLLAEWGTEGGETAGLGLVPGRVERLVPTSLEERIPHVGWNEVEPVRDSVLFEGVSPGRDFYFVHSFHLIPADPETVLATTPYCGGIVSAVQRGAVTGVQFHPEKSQKPGFALLRNFLRS